MKLSDCEISHRVVRGTVVVFLFGARALSAEECVSLLWQYEDAHGPGVVPAYVSPDGWQVLDAAPGPLASRFVFDEAQELVLIDGLAVSAEFVQQWTAVTPEGQWFRVVATDNGHITVQRRDLPADALASTPAPALAAAADAEPGQPPAAAAEAPKAPSRKAKA